MVITRLSYFGVLTGGSRRIRRATATILMDRRRCPVELATIVRICALLGYGDCPAVSSIGWGATPQVPHT